MTNHGVNAILGQKGGDGVKVRNMALCGLFAAVLTVCAWIAIPVGDMAVTLQTFAVALTLWLLGGKQGSITVFVYLLLGAIGVPVFSGFRGGMGALLGTTGGYLFGFMLTALAYWLITFLVNTPLSRVLAMVAGLLLCYICGTVWYAFGYLDFSAVSLGFVLLRCVVPYLIPDGIKLFLAWLLAQRLRRFVY